MNIQPTDIAILLISTAACIYCMLLSRRLKALQSTKDGLGATILALSKSISDMSETASDTRVHTQEMAGQLARHLKEAKQATADLDRQLSEARRLNIRKQDFAQRHDRELEMLLHGGQSAPQPMPEAPRRPEATPVRPLQPADNERLRYEYEVE